MMWFPPSYSLSKHPALFLWPPMFLSSFIPKEVMKRSLSYSPEAGRRKLRFEIIHLTILSLPSPWNASYQLFLSSEMHIGEGFSVFTSDGHVKRFKRWCVQVSMLPNLSKSSLKWWSKWNSNVYTSFSRCASSVAFILSSNCPTHSRTELREESLLCPLLPWSMQQPTKSKCVVSYFTIWASTLWSVA